MPKARVKSLRAVLKSLDPSSEGSGRVLSRGGYSSSPG